MVEKRTDWSDGGHGFRSKITQLGFVSNTLEEKFFGFWQVRKDGLRRLKVGPHEWAYSLIWRKPMQGAAILMIASPEAKRVLTSESQQLLEQPPTELGIDHALIGRLQLAYLNYCAEVGRRCERAFVSVRDFLNLDLFSMSISFEDAREIEKCMRSAGFTCDPNVEWTRPVERRVLTRKMQQLLECSITEIGISVRIAEILEEHVGIICLRQLLQLRWEQIESFSQPGPDCLPNFGPLAVKEIRSKLANAGFVCPPGTMWVVEEDDTFAFANAGQKAA